MPHRKKDTQQQRQWRRMDLHLHTPASVDYKQSDVTYLDLLKKAEEKNLDIISFTDHNTASGYARYLEEIESLELLERLRRLRDDERERLEEYRRLRDEILVLPGFEFTATLGFHILGIFPPDTTVRELEHLLLSLRVPADKLDQGSGEVGATTDALTAYRMINEAGGLVIAAHANSSHGVAMPGFDFGGQTRIAYTQDPNLHALEVTDLDSKSRRRTAAFFSGTKPEYPRRMHSIQGSDAHKLVFDPRYKNEMGVGDRATEILLDEVSFEAIKDLFLGNDFSRTRPYRPPTEEPYDPIRDAREQGDTLVQAFHERLHDKRAIERSVLEDVVALANTNGGTIYIGASANTRNAIVGVERPDQASSELRNAIAKEITPPLEVQVDIVKSQGKNILQVIVPRGSEVPYALGGSAIYVRSENETGLAVRDEIVQLVRDALILEMAGGAVPPSVVEAAPTEPTPAQAQAAVEEQMVSTVPTVEPPRTGVEIVSSSVRKGITYYSVRDLRNSRIVQNVTRASARRLWQYAIEEYEKNRYDPTKLDWIANIAICKKHKRGGKLRYDLAQRIDGRLAVYYGVTEDGIHGPWRELIGSEAAGESEEAPELETPAEGEAVPADSEAHLVPEGALAGLLAAPQDQTTAAQRMEEEPRPVSSEGPVAEGEAEAPTAAAGEQMESRETRPGDYVPEVEEEERVPAHEATLEEMQHASGEQRTAAEPPAQPPHGPLQEPPAAKTRAQEWREILDRAIAEARAAQQAVKNGPAGNLPSPTNGEEAALAEERANTQAEEKAGEIVQSEEQEDDSQRAKNEGEGRS